ncbi:hypothetical protein X733_32765 [Mesorhizobium sp. L2C067A000]|nr:hypothetical protein X733_32765 [Mesorhizobium sp. L2C067A000]
MRSRQGAADLMRYQPGRLFTRMEASAMWGSRRRCALRRNSLVLPDYIVVCTVTGSTHAGMLVGFAEEGRQRNVIGIDASATPAKTKAQVLSIAQHTAKLVDLERELVEEDVVLLEDYAHPHYGIPSEGNQGEAIRLCARLEGMITDPVYEGKSMQGMINLIQKAFFPEGSRVLYAHLGGAPAINGYAYTFRNG